VKYTKVFRVLILAVILSLLLIAIPAAPALAAEDIDPSPSTGEVGDKIDITGDGFKTDLTRAYIYFSSQEWDVGDEIDEDVTVYALVKKRTPDDTGHIDTYFYVPEELDDGDDYEEVVGGYYYIYVTYEDSDLIEAIEDFTVRGIELNPDEGPVGTQVEINGVGFTRSRDIRYIKYGGEDLDDWEGDLETNIHGEFTSYIVIPENTAGEHTILVEDRSYKEASATFTVESEITISLTSGAAGDTVEVTGTGFGDTVEVSITFNGDDVVTDETDNYGNFTAAFDVPDVGVATYDIEAEDVDANKDTAEFTIVIATSVSISPVTTQASPGHVGMEMTVSGTGFIPEATITITYATEPIAVTTATADADGAFTATFKVPESESGEHIITASDGTSTMQVTFTMESEAPPIPAPLLPETDVKAESPVHFDWEGVDDPSGVTYTLQIATDEDFTSASIVLEKEGLTDSEYTVTEEEKLEPTKEEAPYYWRVKAIDGASNESEWSDTGSFYIGGFAWPGWIIHLWWGLGAMGVGFLGFWLGKRRAYYY